MKHAHRYVLTRRYAARIGKFRSPPFGSILRVPIQSLRRVFTLKQRYET